jgi:hypothetical protein
MCLLQRQAVVTDIEPLGVLVQILFLQTS